MHVNRFLFYPNSAWTLYLNIFLCSHIIILATWLDHRQLEKSVLVFFFFKKKIASIKRKKTLPKSDKVTELKCKGISSIYTCKLLTCVCPTRFWAIELSCLCVWVKVMLAHSQVQEIVAIKSSEYRGWTTRSRVNSKTL